MISIITVDKGNSLISASRAHEEIVGNEESNTQEVNKADEFISTGNELVTSQVADKVILVSKEGSMHVPDIEAQIENDNSKTEKVPDQSKDEVYDFNLPNELNETESVPVQIESKFGSTNQNMKLNENTCTTVILTNMSQERSEEKNVYRPREQKTKKGPWKPRKM